MTRRGPRANGAEHAAASATASKLESQLAAASPALREAIQMLMPSLAAYDRALGASQSPVRLRASHQNVADTARFVSAASSVE